MLTHYVARWRLRVGNIHREHVQQTASATLFRRIVCILFGILLQLFVYEAPWQKIFLASTLREKQPRCDFC